MKNFFLIDPWMPFDIIVKYQHMKNEIEIVNLKLWIIIF